MKLLLKGKTRNVKMETVFNLSYIFVLIAGAFSGLCFIDWLMNRGEVDDD